MYTGHCLVSPNCLINLPEVNKILNSILRQMFTFQNQLILDSAMRRMFSLPNCLLKFPDSELTEILECQLLSLTAGTSANHCPPKLKIKPFQNKFKFTSSGILIKNRKFNVNAIRLKYKRFPAHNWFLQNICCKPFGRKVLANWADQIQCFMWRMQI